jgi:hypothetical protein
MHPRPELTLPEKEFLHAWIWAEAHAQDAGASLVKKQQIENAPFAAPMLADIAVATLSPDEQVAVANSPNPLGKPSWPWASAAELLVRHQESRAWLENSRFCATATTMPKQLPAATIN